MKLQRVATIGRWGLALVLALVLLPAPGVAAEEGLNEQLMKAARKGDLERVRTLLDKGGEINARDKEGWTALMSAAKGGNLEVVKLLIDKGAEVNGKNNKGETALIIARGPQGDQIVELLKAHGAK